MAGAAWATTVACYASALCAWQMVAQRPGGPWLPKLSTLVRSVLGRPTPGGSSKGWVTWPGLERRPFEKNGLDWGVALVWLWFSMGFL